MCLGVPAKIKEVVDIDNQIVLVDLSGVKREVNVACVLDSSNRLDDLINKWVLVHVGFALSIVDEDEAYKTLMILDQIGELSATIEELGQGEVE
jgi:hydrogenase expression/formation protein HypC